MCVGVCEMTRHGQVVVPDEPGDWSICVYMMSDGRLRVIIHVRGWMWSVGGCRVGRMIGELVRVGCAHARGQPSVRIIASRDLDAKRERLKQGCLARCCVPLDVDHWMYAVVWSPVSVCTQSSNNISHPFSESMLIAAKGFSIFNRQCTHTHTIAMCAAAPPPVCVCSSRTGIVGLTACGLSGGCPNWPRW